MSKLLINEYPLLVLPSLAKRIGLNEAIVLQQLHYWLGQPNAGVFVDGYKWIHNTYEEWQVNFPFWSVDTVKRTIHDLEKSGIIISAQSAPNPFDKTKSYRIDYQHPALLDEGKLHPSITETTLSETTSNTTKRKVPQKKGDYLDLLQELAGKEQTQQELLIAEMYDKMDSLFRTTFSRNKNTDTIVKFVIGREKLGESIERFVQWVNRDEFNASRIWEYAENPIKIKTRWQVAMADSSAESYSGAVEGV